MGDLERAIRHVRLDLEQASSTYAQIIDTPNERISWERAVANITQSRAAVNELIALSRETRDAEARVVMARVAAEYDDLEHETSRLVAINRRGVTSAIERSVRQERMAAIWVFVTQLGGLTGLVLVGWWGLRRVAREQQQLGQVKALEERNRELDAFAGRVAHDLRNPLSSIMFTTEMLADTATAQQEARMIDRLRRGGQRIQALIDDLLALSRNRTATDAACNPAVVAAKLHDDFTERFGEAASMREDVEAATVPYSEGLLAQAVWNIVENGVKYRRAGIKPDICVQGRVAARRYELRVCDNGIGMSADEAIRVFEPFYRAEKSRGIAGTGLGLSIVKRVVEARGGTVSIESEPQQGTTFVLSLPLAA